MKKLFTRIVGIFKPKPKLTVLEQFRELDDYHQKLIEEVTAIPDYLRCRGNDTATSVYFENKEGRQVFINKLLSEM